jgi:hypothetical protein
MEAIASESDNTNLSQPGTACLWVFRSAVVLRLWVVTETSEENGNWAS